jgi:hypothetical protein
VQGWKDWDEVQRLLDLAAADAVPDPVTLTESSSPTEGKPR